jgi:hypothetical protein
MRESYESGKETTLVRLILKHIPKEYDIIRTFNYDRRLEAVTEESYLIADYTILESDADQKVYVVYAAIVFVVTKSTFKSCKSVFWSFPRRKTVLEGLRTRWQK